MYFKWAIFLVASVLSVAAVSLSVKRWSMFKKPESKIWPTTKTTAPTVSTPLGKYIGVLKTLSDGSQVIKYMGVPFAQPPVGDLRFRRPQPLPKGSPQDVIKADRSQKSCNSVTKKSTDPHYGEDCLYLNIYIPTGANTSNVKDQRKPYSVMIWLHPGGFVAGSVFPEPMKLVTRGNVIVVMVNYRMGVLGFLTTNDDALPGNNGLWDQYMAVKWVKENIGHFGGNQNSITVFGESAGSISSHILSLSPVSSNLFQKVILQSGSAPTMFSRDYEQKAYHFGHLVGCGNFTSHAELAKCLRGISISDILRFSLPNSFDISAARRQLDFIWMPVVDGEMIEDYPDKLLKNQSYLERVGAFNKDYIIGVLNNEGGLVVDNFLNQIPLSTLQNATFYSDLLDFFFYMRYGLRPDDTSQLSTAANRFYFGAENVSFPLPEQTVLDTVSDAIFVYPAVETALSVSACNKTRPPLCQDTTADISGPKPDPLCQKATARVFFYLFDYCPSNDPCQVPCMSHGSDFYYEFPKQTTGDKESDKMSDIFIDLLTTFGKTSDPGSVLQGGWPTFEPYNQYYLRLSPQPTVRQKLYPYRMRLWKDQLPSLLESSSNNTAN